MSNPARINPLTIRRALTYIIRRRNITTSPKNQDTAIKDINCPPVKVEAPSARKNWISYGFETKNYEADRWATHSIFFASVTMCMTIGGYYLIYMPDFNLRDWAQREAYLELRRRELAGLPLVDPNLIPPEQIMLPTDEELGDTEIVL